MGSVTGMGNRGNCSLNIAIHRSRVRARDRTNCARVFAIIRECKTTHTFSRPLTFALSLLMASKQVLSGHVQGAPGRLGTFTSSSQEIHKKKGSTTSGAGGKPVTGWKPTVFDFKSGASTTQCPTCQGTGRIPKGKLREVGRLPFNMS